MPRNVKESDDEWETRGGRRTRTMPGSSSILDSPLRRSTRIKQPAAQNDSSPESNGDVVVVGVVKSTRRRTIGLDGSIPEITRSLRVRCNSAASDASEVTESDSQAESAAKRTTRRSIASLPSAETSAKMRAKAGRVTRAGSESKSTPPVGRITRRTRASSMELEMTDQTRIREVGTPIKSRKRASVMPSQPEVAEEFENSRTEGTVVEVDDHEAETSHRSFETSRRGSKGNASEADEKMEVDEAPVVESEIDTMSQISFHEMTEEQASVASVPTVREDSMETSESPMKDAHRDEQSPQRRIVPNPEKASVTMIENLSRKSLEIDDTSASNKENEASNASGDSLLTNASRTNAETITSPRKSLNSSFSKITEKRDSICLVEGPPEARRGSLELVKAEQIVANDIQTRKDYSLEAKCVVLIETMDVEKIAISKTDSPKIPPTQETPNVVEEDKDSELIVEIENNVDTEKKVNTTATSIVADATPDQTENPKSEEEKSDDVQIIEIAEPNELADSSESKEKVPIDEDIIKEKLSSNLTNVESTIPESTMDKEKLENSQGTEETVVRDETTSTSPPIQVDPPSPRNNDPIESEEREAVSREKTIFAIGTIIPEATEVEVTPLKPEEESSCASPGAKATNCRASMDGEGITEDNRDKIICENLKERKSSIVAESPSSGTNAEECSRLIEEAMDKSLSDEISTKRSKEQRDKGGKTEEEKLEIFAESDYLKPHYETDDESETAVWASFKEVPGSDWISLEKKADPNNSEETSRKSRNAEDEEKDVDDAADSIHSYSTERNESEGEIALVNNDVWQTAKITKKNRDNGDYDSDDTVIASNEKKSTDDASERMVDEEPNNEETAMDVSSHCIETGDQKKSNFSEVSPKKRCSLNNSKFQEGREKDSSLVSRRESPSNLDDEPSEASPEPEANSSKRSIVKTPKRRNSSVTQQNYDSGENENNQTPKTPVRGSRKSLDVSTLVASGSEKRKSLNKSASKHEKETFDKDNSNSDDAEICSQDSNSADVSRKVSQKFDRKSPNTSKIDTENSDFEDKTRSLEKFNRSLKSDGKTKDDDDVARQESTETSASRSKRRSLKNKNESKNHHENSDEENEEDSRSKMSASLKSEKHRKSGNGKNTSRLHGESSEDETDNSQRKLRGLSSSSSGRMAKSDKDRSILEAINSDSHGCSESEDEDTTIQKIPRFLFDVDTSSDDDNEEDREKSIDSDIADDMNLAGKSDLAYSDEDVPGDDCMVTESESCDSEDDSGADLNDFVVNDDEYESEEESDENENEASSKEARRVKGKKRKRIISRPGNDSDTSESVEEEAKEEESNGKESDNMDTSLINVEASEVTHTPRKHKEVQAENTSEECPSDVIEASVDSRPSESEQEDSQSARVSFNDLDKSNQTPKKQKPNDSIGTAEKIASLNESGKASSKKMKHLLPQCSTPKLTPRHDLPLEKSTPAKPEKTAKLETPTSKPEASRKSILSASLKEAKTPKAATSLLHTSLPTGHRTILLELKSPKLTALHRTMAEPNIDSPEVRFLMKERLNESLPALKLQQHAREARRGISGNVSAEKIDNDDEEENHEAIENVSVPVEIVDNELVHSDKKKKKKKKKKNKQADKLEVNDTSDNCVVTSLATGEESNVILNESPEAPSEETAIEKTKKRKKNKKISEPMEIEEASVHEMEQAPVKKKKRKQKQWDEEPTVEETIVRDVEDIRKKKKKKKNREAEMEQEIVIQETVEHEEKKKKKKKKKVSMVELEITTSRKKLIPISTEIGSFESQSSEKERSSAGVSKKAKAQENSTRLERKKKASNLASVESTEKTRIKRLPDEVLESLSEIAERPQKRRKIVKDDKPLPSKRMLSPRGATLKDVQVNDNFVSLSSSGGTTQFGIVDLARATKQSKKSDAAKSFRERMLARNPRQPISAYLMYQQKRKASGNE